LRCPWKIIQQREKDYKFIPRNKGGYMMFFAGRGPTPGNDVMPTEILADELKHFRKKQ
jgi:hypothetical protein